MSIKSASAKTDVTYAVISYVRTVTTVYEKQVFYMTLTYMTVVVMVLF